MRIKEVANIFTTVRDFDIADPRNWNTNWQAISENFLTSIHNLKTKGVSHIQASNTRRMCKWLTTPLIHICHKTTPTSVQFPKISYSFKLCIEGPSIIYLGRVKISTPYILASCPKWQPFQNCTVFFGTPCII